MRLAFILPKVEPAKVEPPKVCPRPGCNGRHKMTVQEVARCVPGMKQTQVFGGMQTPAMGSDGTSAKVKRVESAVNVNRLPAWYGNHLERGGVNLTRVLS